MVEENIVRRCGDLFHGRSWVDTTKAGIVASSYRGNKNVHNNTNVTTDYNDDIDFMPMPPSLPPLM